MQLARSNRQTGFLGDWIWAFPATYLVHIAEEYWGGEGFYRWIRRIAGAGITADQFLLINGAFWVVMTAVVLISRRTRSWRWAVIAFGTLVLVNGALHLLGTLYTRSYSPGLVSGALLWIPLGIFTLTRARQIVPRGEFWLGTVVGLGLQALASLQALGAGGPGSSY